MSRTLILALITIMCWGIWGFANKLAVMRAHPMSVIFYTFLFNVILIIPAYFLAKYNKANLFPEKSAFLFIFLAVMAAFIASICFVYLLNQHKASWIVPITSIYPLVVVLLCYIFLGERLTVVQLSGAFFIVLGLAFMTR